MSTTAIPDNCWKCGRPISMVSVFHDGRRFHTECAPGLVYHNPAPHAAAPGPSGPSFTGTVAAGTPEPLSTGFERVYAEIHGEPVAELVQRLRAEAEDWQDPVAKMHREAAAAIERLQRELDEARGIVRNIYWMACRYADGRNTYAPGMYNRAIAKAYDAGWLTFDHTGRRYEVQYARDGMSPEWKTAEERATSAEASLAAAREALKPFAAVAEHDIGESEDDADLFTPMSAHNRAPRLTVGDLRAARAILGDHPTQERTDG